MSDLPPLQRLRAWRSRSPRLRAAGMAALVVLAASPAAASPLLSEVLYDGIGSDDGQVFVELWGAPGSSLDGLTLEGVNGSNGSVGPVIELSGVMPADGLLVVADELSSGGTLVPGADLLASFDFQNGPDSVELRDGDVVLDALGYGDFGAGDVFAGEGAPAPDTAAGESLARVFADVDSDDNAADFEILATPTPGAAELAPVPEPGTAGLLGVGLGLAGLARGGRRRRRPADG